MIAKTLLDYLSSVLDVPVVMEAPDQFTDYVLIDQTGSSRTNHITTTTLALQSYGATLYEAMLLNKEVEEAMDGFAELDEVTRVELNTDYNFTNTATKQYRWQAVYNITHY
jgi:hypothetical protein